LPASAQRLVESDQIHRLRCPAPYQQILVGIEFMFSIENREKMGKAGTVRFSGKLNCFPIRLYCAFGALARRTCFWE
jgi:hypothetical protein